MLHLSPHTAHLQTPAHADLVATGVPFFDIGRQHAALRGEILAALTRVYDSSQFVLGPDIARLETALAGYCHARHAIACASGSDALLLALMHYQVGPGDEVLLPSFTFFATAGAVSRLGARPIFVDIEPTGFNLDPAQLEASISPRTKAIIPVHLYGQCADMSAILAIAGRHGVPVIEDACQAIGAEIGSRRAGSLGAINCFSFYPSKNLGGLGDGGFMTTDDDEIAARLRMLRVHGEKVRYHHSLVGINSRLDTFQAAALEVKLPHLDRWIEARRENARRYQALFADCGLDAKLGLPVELPGHRHTWNQYVVRVPQGRRDALREHLAKAKIGTQIYYPVPLDQQECFCELGYLAGALPETARAAQETLALPIFPELRVDEQEFVVQQIAAFYGIELRTGRAALRGPKFLKLPQTDDGVRRAS
ncbi:MAG: DegT/DnrJ/EryC1/StrS family aminotransferase [Pirellulales bacterium]|nr:DegT/DnrJ/EryC1/StrS family aminotransferase [Pirellulales bacterium]